jgi:hypothetical protein
MEKVRRKAKQMTRLLIHGIAHRATALGNRHSRIGMMAKYARRLLLARSAPVEIRVMKRILLIIRLFLAYYRRFRRSLAAILPASTRSVVIDFK